MVIINTSAMEASIQAVSPELIWELRMTEGSVVEGAGGAVDAAADTAAGSGSAQAKGTGNASKTNSNDRDNVVINLSPLS